MIVCLWHKEVVSVATVEQKMGQSREAGVAEGRDVRGDWEVTGWGDTPPTPSLVGGCKDFGICSESSGSHGVF